MPPKKLTGVRTMTISVIQTFLENMKSRVPMIVTIPEKSWVKSKEHTIGQNICICDNTADDISGTVSVKVREGKYLNVSDGFGTDILYCLVGHAVIDHIHKPRGSRRGMTITRIRDR